MAGVTTSVGEALKLATRGAFNVGSLADGEFTRGGSRPVSGLGSFPLEWRHFQNFSVTISFSANYSRVHHFPPVYEGDPPEIECEAVDRTETYSLSMSATKTWVRQSEANELQLIDPTDGQFAISRNYYDNQPLEPFSVTRFINAVGTVPDSWSGSVTVIDWTGDACETTITTDTYDAEITSVVPTLRCSRTSIPNWTTVASMGGSFPGLFNSDLFDELAAISPMISTDPPAPGVGIIYTATGTGGVGSGYTSGSSSFSLTISLTA